MSTLRAEAIYKRIKLRQVVKGISLEISSGEYVCASAPATASATVFSC